MLKFNIVIMLQLHFFRFNFQFCVVTTLLLQLSLVRLCQRSCFHLKYLWSSQTRLESTLLLLPRAQLDTSLLSVKNIQVWSAQT